LVAKTETGKIMRQDNASGLRTCARKSGQFNALRTAFLKAPGAPPTDERMSQQRQ